MLTEPEGLEVQTRNDKAPFDMMNQSVALWDQANKEH